MNHKKIRMPALILAGALMIGCSTAGVTTGVMNINQPAETTVDMQNASGLAGKIIQAAGSFFTVEAQAKNIEGKKSWKAYYTTAGKLEQNFGAQSLQDDLSDMEPGDKARLWVTCSNENTHTTDWYMSNKVISSLEDSSSASGGAYTYKLTWQKKDASGSNSGTPKELYNNTTVGGDVSQGGTGLHEADSSLQNMMYLDPLKQGESGVVTLEISLDGVTQNNDYQDTVAKLQMEFGVEEQAAATSSSGSSGNRTHLVKTGDFQMMPYYVAGIAAGLILLFMGIWNEKKRGNVK